MPPRMDRRDFLKLAATLPVSMALQPYLRVFNPSLPPQVGHKNILIVVFDAFSGYHLPFYGYSRITTPHIARLAERAIVYHNHYAGGDFTSPGTASLLTGLLPWTHRAFWINAPVTPRLAGENIFKAFSHYYRIAYSHNPLVNTLFDQFAVSLDHYIPRDALMLTSDGFLDSLFRKDQDTATVASIRTFQSDLYGYSYSLFLSHLYEARIKAEIAGLKPRFPRGLPRTTNDSYFLLETAVDWLKRQLGRLPQPYLGYFHFMPPHAPSASPVEFLNRFANDGFTTPDKPEDVFSPHLQPDRLLRERQAYDEFILYLDREFGRLFDYLESSGILENSWVVLTADPGELFERGFRGHGGPLLYQGLVRIPLLIFEPGRTSRTDIYSNTSAVDLLPTLLHLAGEDAAPWVEGTLLPPFAPASPDPGRPIYCMYVRTKVPDEPLTQATVMVLKDRYMLLDFFGFEELGTVGERIELYDVQADPEELTNLYSAANPTAVSMLAELKARLAEVNRPYGA